MQTVIETESYLRAAKDAQMSADEMAAAVDLVAADPEAGDLMQGERNALRQLTATLKESLK